MRSINFICEKDSDFDEFIKDYEFLDDKEYLVRVHTGIHSTDNIMPFVNRVLRKIPNAKIIGSSTSGVIFKGEIVTDHCLVSITEFGHTQVRTLMVPISDGDRDIITGEQLAWDLTEDFLTKESLFMVALFARPFIKIVDFMEGINKNAENLQVIGGFATTQEELFVNIKKTGFVFNNNEVSEQSAAFAVLDSGTLSVKSDIIYATEPVGEIGTITDADGFIIKEIDGENAVTWYEKQVRVNLDDEENREITAVFPIVRVDYGEIPWEVTYSSQKGAERLFPDEKDPVLYVPSEVRIGKRVRIAYYSIQKAIERCERVCHNINRSPAEVLFGYSCLSNQTMFRNCAKRELMPFAPTNLCGALLLGELGNMKKNNSYCNFSFTIAAMAEEARAIKLDTNALRQNVDEIFAHNKDMEDALIKRFMNNTSNNHTENMIPDEDDENSFVDGSIGFGNIAQFSVDFSQRIVDKICMVTVRNEEILKAFLSKTKFKIYYSRCLKEISSYINDARYRYYIYKGTSLVIGAENSVEDDEFIQKMRDVQAHISDFEFAEFVVVSEFSVVLHEINMLQKAELTHFQMKANQDRFIIYTPELGLEKDQAQNMKMLSIISDAVSNDRVVPYFQKIHDNSQGGVDMYEALMRLVDREGNVYTPYQFMDLAKEYGYYTDLSYAMLTKTLEIFRDRKEIITLNMNISDIYNHIIVNYIVNFLKDAPHPENFVFEITETEEIADYDRIFQFTEEIHKVGGKIAIDDFGSGFSNIVNVFRINSDYLKVDGAIVRNITNDVYAREFLEMIAQWSDRHGKMVVAEFVENEAIQNIIKEFKIRFSQGFMFARPTGSIGTFSEEFEE